MRVSYRKEFAGRLLRAIDTRGALEKQKPNLRTGVRIVRAPVYQVIGFWTDFEGAPPAAEGVVTLAATADWVGVGLDEREAMPLWVRHVRETTPASGVRTGKD